MTFLVPPGFIMGGATMAAGYLPPWAYDLSYACPLVWQYRFWRDFALRGVPTSAMTATYGPYVINLTVIAALEVFVWSRSTAEHREVTVSRVISPHD